MNKITIGPAKNFKGNVNIPADKSISHRALMIGSLADGVTLVSNLLEADDVLSTLTCLQKLGVEIEKNAENYEVHGVGKYGFSKPEEPLDVGNSGTTLRILPGILAGQDFSAKLIGDDSVSQRPMERVLKPLRDMGAEALSTDGHAPVKIIGGKLKAIDYKTEVPSAQVKSAILLAGLLAEGETEVSEKYPSRDHTELMLQYFGVQVSEKFGNVTVHGGSDLKAKELKIPADFSSAAYFIAAALLVPNSEIHMDNVGINPKRIGLLEVLNRMGCDVLADSIGQTVCNERVAHLSVKHSPLKATVVEPFEVPSLIDEFPILAVIATQAEGETIVSGAEELRVKETDRIKAVVYELTKMGADIVEKPDGFAVNGPVKLKGADVDSHGDHRLAMALGIAALIAEGNTVINGADAVRVSFPNFFEVLESVS